MWIYNIELGVQFYILMTLYFKNVNTIIKESSFHKVQCIHYAETLLRHMSGLISLSMGLEASSLNVIWKFPTIKIHIRYTHLLQLVFRIISTCYNRINKTILMKVGLFFFFFFYFKFFFYFMIKWHPFHVFLVKEDNSVPPCIISGTSGAPV